MQGRQMRVAKAFDLLRNTGFLFDLFDGFSIATKLFLQNKMVKERKETFMSDVGEDDCKNMKSTCCASWLTQV